MDRTSKNSYYLLKRQFGVSALLNKRKDDADVVPDFQTGTYVETNDVGDDALPVKLVLLPLNYRIQEKLPNFQGDIQIGDREFLIDNKYNITLADEFTINSKTYNVIHITDYTADVCYGILRTV